MDWGNVFINLASAVIGGLIALGGVIITLRTEATARKQERIDNAKPIMINYPSRAIPDQAHVPHYHFWASDDTELKKLYGAFKNTDNGIMFLDSFESESKQYLPQRNSAVDKNEAFIIVLHAPKGETLTKWRIHCHDIYGTKYYYDAEYGQDNDKQQRILIGNIQAEE